MSILTGKQVNAAVWVLAAALVANGCDHSEPGRYLDQDSAATMTINTGTVIAANRIKQPNIGSDTRTTIGVHGGHLPNVAIVNDVAFGVAAAGSMVLNSVIGVSLDNEPENVNWFQYEIRLANGKTINIANRIHKETRPFVAGDRVKLVIKGSKHELLPK